MLWIRSESHEKKARCQTIVWIKADSVDADPDLRVTVRRGERRIF